jgi:cytochrome c5
MQLTTRLPKRRRARNTRSPRPEPKRPAQPAKPAPQSAETRAARRAGGPQDHALYSCLCGYCFKAEVSTSVGCPHCGTEQAW